VHFACLLHTNLKPFQQNYAGIIMCSFRQRNPVLHLQVILRYVQMLHGLLVVNNDYMLIPGTSGVAEYSYYADQNIL
jgi:hypothetical protein